MSYLERSGMEPIQNQKRILRPGIVHDFPEVEPPVSLRTLDGVLTLSRYGGLQRMYFCNVLVVKDTLPSPFS
jgi:hypothetical protein